MKNYDIHERIFNFIVEVLSLLNKLPKNLTNLVVFNQITRSVTSNCFTIVRKEGLEFPYSYESSVDIFSF
ncbi:MAG: hypothetical protein ACD_30C00112G0017 [uncultured bacterium]|uniref:Uncharacterized protein n=2 Tax=Candidatus Daviesiibacteriota TaxID=1752718 RepID=A0A0G0F0Q6_9BACT|nr:MAG: hypothetical protein ACD_30C00112G0017 [uncultured bacterium]KKQ07235.1 MAG: hypothetical protein US19_C0052G0006 [Candidatus Daviesbacteria bacterium GW2011_GWB1_36_5]KKQ15306.1 MAG: hypothetical protein US28_C0019G0039 [Candidatus Daviesbacteria bacterium GW2011_GWA1_36_8]